MPLVDAEPSPQERKDESQSTHAHSPLESAVARRWFSSGVQQLGQKLHLPTVVAAVLALLLMVIGWPLVLAATLIACVHMRHGPAAVIQSLLALVTIKFLNDALYDFPPYFGLLAWLALFVSAVIVSTRCRKQALPILLPLWVFVVVVAVITPFASSDPTVSWFKLVSFLVGASTAIVASSALGDEGARFLRAWLPSVTLAIVVVSVATFPFPGVSFRTAPNLFQGVLNHSQALAAVLAPLLALLASRWLFYRTTFQRFDRVALLTTAAMVIATNARTAVIAVALGIGCTALLGLFQNRRSRRRSGNALAVGTLIGLLAVGAVFANSTARDAVLEFVFKHSTEATVEDAFMASRGAGIAGQWGSFLESPLLGNGFGVYPEGWTISKPVIVFGLPISAPVEKGFLPTAILEEVGLSGTLAFLVLVITMVRSVTSKGDMAWTAVLLTCLFVNIGEAVFFSLGGLGLYFWLWMGLALRGPGSQGESGAPPNTAAAAPYRNILP